MDTRHPQLERCYDLAIKGAWFHPFFLIPLGHCDWTEADPEVVKTAGVRPSMKDGAASIELALNTEWIAGVPDEEIFGLLCHEILHCMLQHHERGGGKNQETWGEATDMAINQTLTDSGIKIPKGGLMPPHEHSEASAEELYELLDKKEMPKPKNADPNHVGRGCMPQKGENPSAGQNNPSDEPSDGQGQGDGQGEGDGQGDGQSPGEGQASGSGGAQSSDRAWGEMVAQAQVMGRGQGSAKTIAKLFKPVPVKTKWDRLLNRTARRAAAKGGRDSQTFAKVNRRSNDIVFPGWQSNKPAITVIIDSSGSVSDAMLRSAISSTIQCSKVSSTRVFLALHDGHCYWSGWIKPETTVQSIAALCNSRGGTDPREAFEAVAECKGKFDAGVYLTDGEVGQYPEKPSNVKRMIVGIVGDRKSSWRAQVPDTWLEVPVEIDGAAGDPGDFTQQDDGW